jgi:hypothetical protein
VGGALVGCLDAGGVGGWAAQADKDTRNKITVAPTVQKTHRNPVSTLQWGMIEYLLIIVSNPRNPRVSPPLL